MAVFNSRVAYTLIGAAVGLGFAVWAIAHDAVQPARAAIVVAAGPLFGAFAGFDFYATRQWTGKVALLLRLELSCTSAACLTGLCGRLVGVVGRQDMTAMTLGGAGIGLAIWLNVVLSDLRDRAA